MKKYFSFVIILLMSSIVVNGCSTKRGGFASSGGDGVSSDDSLVPDLLDTIRTDDDLLRDTAIPDDGNGDIYQSLTAASNETSDAPREFILQGLVVQGNETTNYTPTGALGWTQDGETIVNVARITLPNVSFTFDETGAMSAVTANFADKSYSSNATKNANIRGTDTVISDATTATLTVDRNDIFGFAVGQEANYMAYIGWNLERTRGEANALRNDVDRSYRIYGNMIAGIETARENIPENGEVAFAGKGRGYYNHVQRGENYATIFDIVVNVDFSDNNWLLYTENTMRCATKNNYSNCVAETTIPLDFGTPDYSLETPTNQYYAINELRSDVSLTQDSDFSGTVYGHFYGSDARELGGIFTMRGKTDGYYYGAFGAERNIISLSVGFVSAIEQQTVSVPIASTTTHDSLYAVAGDANVGAFTVKGLSVYKRDDNSQHTRAPNRAWSTADIETDITRLGRIVNSGAKLDFNGDGYISGVNLYVRDEDNADRTYNATLATPTSATAFTAPIPDFDGDGVTNTTEITVDRETIFGFESNYMAYIAWNVSDGFDDASPDLVDSDYNINGAMLAGIETESFNLSGIIEFNGKGSGIYKNTDPDNGKGYETVFDVTASVNFASYKIALTASNTQCVGGDAIGEVCYGVAAVPYYLDFNAVGATALSFDNGDSQNLSAVNNISRTLGDHGSGLAITLDARFYGANAWELGGTFALTDDTNYYYGVFGAERKGITSESKAFNTDRVSTAEAVAGTVTPSTVASLTAVTFSGVETPVTMKALSVYKDDRTDYTSAPNRNAQEYGDATDSVSLARVSNSSALLTFDENGNISGVTVNLKDNTYIAAIANPDSAETVTTAFTTGAGDATTANISVNRSSDLFGFDTDYMAYIDWNLKKPSGAGSVYDMSGSMIAGLETESFTLTDEYTFGGKGRGTYDNIDDDTPSYQTIFDVNATVDFTDKTIDISSSNTCQAVDCANQPLSELDFNTPTALSFVGGNIISGAITTDDLSGTLDARFYGKDTNSASELGGTFALIDKTADNQSYYYGAFGTARNYQTVYNGIVGNGSNITTVNRQNLIKFGDPEDAGTGVTRIQANTVELVKHNGTQTITINKSLKNGSLDHGSNIQYSYLANGKINPGSLEFYFSNNKDYSIAQGIGNTDLYLDSTETTFGFEQTDAPDYFGFNRRDSVFGFASEHMALVHWRTQKTEYEARGYSIIGYDTSGSNLPVTGDTKFTGRGEGQYYDTRTAPSIYFNIIADIDFTARTVVLTSENTCISIITSYCGQNDYQRDDLNFTGNLSYSANKNLVTGNDVTTSGDGSSDDATKLTGSVEARFFGTKGIRNSVEYDDAAKTFGGTFYLYNGSASYIGYFGALRSYISSHIDITADLTAIGAPTTFNTVNSLTGFNDPDRASTVDNALQANAVQITKNIFNQTIFSNRFTQAVVVFDYDADGEFVADGQLADPDPVHLLYLTDVKYERTSAIAGKDAGGITVSRPIEFSQTNGLETFGFDANYMAITQWQLNETRYDVIGYALNGFANAGTDIPTPASDTGSITFVGEGHGRYYDADNAYNTDFNVQADVNFFNRTVILDARNTRCDPLAADALDCSLERPQLNDFNFNVLLSYDAGENIITSTTVATTPDLTDDYNYASLTGTLEAKFYGAADNIAKEFGGTFAMQNSAGVYIGYFGAAREYTHSNSEIQTDYAGTPKATDMPKTLNANDLFSFNHTKNNNTSNNAQPIFSAVQVTKNDGNETITSNNIIGAVVEFDYKSLNINFADTGLTLYLADKKYEATAGTGNESNINATTISATINDGTVDIPTKLQLDRSIIINGARFAYMANIYWQLDEALYSSYGYGITGYETDNITAPATPISGSSNAGIPAAETGIITFEGRGQGRYAGNVNFATDFDIVADVNFGTREVVLTGIIEGGHDLNFNSTLSYVEDTNSLNGSIATAGGADYGRLIGTAEANFYGDYATELGGTFTMFDDHIAYIGWFGAQSQRDYRIFPTEITATTHTGTPTGSDINKHNLSGFNDTSRGGKTDNALPILLVQIKGHEDNRLIHSEQITGAVTKFNFNSSATPKFTGSGFSVYFADKKYQPTSSIQASETVIAVTNDFSSGNDNISSLSLLRDSGTFGFTVNYMALVSWTANSGDDNRHAYGMTGFETLDTGSNSIPTAGTSLSFTGQGAGAYYNQDADAIALDTTNTVFTVTATTNFVARTVAVTGTHTSDGHSHLNFSGTLGYASSTNDLTTDTANNGVVFTTATGDDQMTGTANARFYGPAAAELGGTFSMQNTDTVYIGWFGAEKQP